MKKPRQLEFEISRQGGKRKGAGRPKLLKHEPSHAKRERISQRTPLMITIKLAERAPSLRTPRFMKRLARTIRLSATKGLSINQYAIEGDHVHFMAEADSNTALKRGMQSLISTLTWALRENFRYFGRVLRGRFHTLVCKTPTEVRNALRYVLFNHAKHCGQKPFIDEFSSAASFDDLESLVSGVRRGSQKWKVEMPEPRSWLQRVGWRSAK